MDAADLAFLSQWRWVVHIARATCYARRMAEIDGKRVNQYMHRLIVQAPRDLVVDHIDHDGLNNRRSNLRAVSHTRNLWNVATKRDGVFWHHPTQKWRARITHYEQRLFLGGYTDKDEAMTARQYACAVLRDEASVPAFDLLRMPPTARVLIQNKLAAS